MEGITESTTVSIGLIAVIIALFASSIYWLVTSILTNRLAIAEGRKHGRETTKEVAELNTILKATTKDLNARIDRMKDDYHNVDKRLGNIENMFTSYIKSIEKMQITMDKMSDKIDKII